MKCECGESVRDAQCFFCGAWHDNYGFDTWPKMPMSEPVPESAAECEFGQDEYQWRLRQAGL